MIISPINFQYKITQNSVQNQRAVKANFPSIAHDTVSFGAMKKKEFEGIDLAVVQKFKAPIEKFNTNEDLQNWAGEKVIAIAKMDFGGRRAETKSQRKAMLKEWFVYVFNENDAYANTTAFLILNAVTKALAPDNDKIPPVLNKGVFADCIYEIDKNTKINPNFRFDLNEMYQNKLRAFYIDDIETDTGETATKWVVIPSKKHDPKNFDANVEKLKALSYKTWCTKSNNAEPYLSCGDFHVFLENGKPKLGVRFAGAVIREIQGEANNGKIPFAYLDTVKKHIKEDRLKLSADAKNQIKAAEQTKKEVDKIKADLNDAIKNNDVKAIFNYFGIDAEYDKDGYLTISEFKVPFHNYTFNDLGIDENKLFEKIKTIKGKAIFKNSQVTNLGNLQSVGGDADFCESQVTDLGNLVSIGGDVFIVNSLLSMEDFKGIYLKGYFADYHNLLPWYYNNY